MDSREYQTLTQLAHTDLEQFWANQAKQYVSWFSPWSQVLQGDFNTRDRHWFVGATLNACYNCVDRHLETRGNQVAVIWEGNNPNDATTLTYHQLHQRICQFANLLKKLGITKGDRVCIYLPMIPEAVVAMLACARIGAIHSVVFGGFSTDALKTRILDADCRLLITADESIRGEKTIALKQHADEAVAQCPNLKNLIVVKHTGNTIQWNPQRDIWYHDAIKNESIDCPVEHMQSTDPLFILYTSGSTGKPKGALHSTGSYLVYVAMTFQQVFNYQPGDVYWCTADIGWITGHSYLVYGPLAQGATTLLFDGVPNYPSFSRYWQIIDKYQVNQFYTSPTALRALRREGDHWVQASSRNSLKLLGSVGEPLNPEVWTWFNEVVGEKRCEIVNTWWQTETGGIMLTPLPNITPPAPGTTGDPIPGVFPEVVNHQGQSVDPNQSGQLVIKKPWPGLMQSIYGDHQRFIDTYLKEIPGCYLTGDGAYRDTEGRYWITGRNDDVLKVSGHRIGTEELESAFISHPAIAEAAVVGTPHEIKGESIYAFVTPRASVVPSETLKKELLLHIRNNIGPFATPDTIQWTTALPKTRSGKIMRRILRKIANHELDNLGDISTLADPSVLEKIIQEGNPQK